MFFTINRGRLHISRDASATHVRYGLRSAHLFHRRKTAAPIPGRHLWFGRLYFFKARRL